ASGIYSVSVDNGNCISAPSEGATVDVNAAPLAGVAEALGILTAAQTGAAYQWYDCSGTPIFGATGQTFVPVVDGSYKVEISLGTCTVTSACIDATVLGIKGFDAVPEFKYYPNPVVDVLNISYANPILKTTVFDIAERTVMTKIAHSETTQLNLSGLPAGVYFVEVHAANASTVFRIIRK
ncbi:T9SS type A sorting domain-containing protein, partial [Flavobacterium noncentrifugens]